jgi:hypothetical protein
MAASTLDRLRTHVRREWFGDASPEGVAWKAPVLFIASFVVLATVVQLLRVWSADPLDRLYGEDGFTWLADAQDGGLSALTATYNGYLQTSSRLIAELVAALPVHSWAAVMAIGGALIVSGCALVVWIASADLIRDPWLRGALAAMTVLVGAASQEMFGNVVNTIWFMTFACFWLLLWRPRSERGAMLAGVGLFVGAISHSATLLLAPLWLLRLLSARDGRDRWIVGGFAVGAVLQVVAILVDGGFGGNGVPAGEEFSTAPFWDWNLIPAYAQRGVGGTLAGYRADAWLWEGLGWAYVALAFAALAGFVAWALRTPRTRLLVPLIVGLSVAIFLITGYLRWGSGGSGFFWAIGESSDIGARYIVVPALLLLCALLIQLDAAVLSARTPVSSRGRIAAYAAVGAIVAVSLFSFHLDPPVDSARWSPELDRAEAACRAQGADTVDVLTSSQPFGQRYVEVQCDRLE